MGNSMMARASRPGVSASATLTGANARVVSTTKMPRPAYQPGNRCVEETPVTVFQVNLLTLPPKSKYQAQQSYQSRPLHHLYTRALRFSAGVEQKYLPSAKISPPKNQRPHTPATD
jgi:hypothetical protein